VCVCTCVYVPFNVGSMWPEFTKLATKRQVSQVHNKVLNFPHSLIPVQLTGKICGRDTSVIEYVVPVRSLVTDLIKMYAFFRKHISAEYKVLKETQHTKSY